jgi:hypothetical protein
MQYLKTLAFAAAASLLASAANAAITVQYWTDQSTVAQDATLANISVANLGTASGFGEVDALNFLTNDSPNTTIDSWLGITTTGDGGHAMDNTVFLFTGSTFLHAGLNSYTVSHDDGLTLNVDGIGTVVNSPAPSSPADLPFSVNAPTAGFYNFQLAYGECCTGPAVLQLASLNATPFGSGAVPEPATWALMIMGFGGAGAMLRRRRMVLAQA